MKKSTKQKIIVLFIVLVFSMSSLAYIISSVTGYGNENQNKIKPLDEFVIDGEIDKAVEDQYIQNGFTFLKFYYAEADPMFMTYIESLPDMTAISSGQKQLFVQKIESVNNTIVISNMNGENELTNITQSAVFESLCETLVMPPIECGLSKLIENTTLNSTD
ncbi:MAG: hypothetical protein V1802_00110 [Candidatus Aenigmatarchaeota archaeon]